MKPMTKGLKRRIVSFAAVAITLSIYIPLTDSRWGIYLALCAGYSVLVLGLAWSDGKLSQITQQGNRPVGEIVRIHAAFLLALMLWIWFAQHIKPSLPDWVVIEGDRHESWFLVFVLLGIVAILLVELRWLGAKHQADPGEAGN